MINEHIFKAYDIRGLYPQEINEISIQKIVSALCSMWEDGFVVVAHDGRYGSQELALFAKQQIDTLLNSERAIFVGLATTPMFYFLVNHLNASGGIMITASHNPKEYNGVKAVGAKAIPFSGKDILSVIHHHNE